MEKRTFQIRIEDDGWSKVAYFLLDNEWKADLDSNPAHADDNYEQLWSFKSLIKEMYELGRKWVEVEFLPDETI